MTVKDISLVLGVCPQTVRDITKRLRQKGYWIIGDNDGMHITHDLGVMHSQCDRLMNLADEHRLSVEGMLKGERKELSSIEEAYLSLLDELKDPRKSAIETPEEWRTEFERIEVREDGSVSL